MKIVTEKYDHHASSLTPLPTGSKVLCQNTRTLKWDKAWSIVEVKPHRQYIVKMEGSIRLSLRNRRHLQRIDPRKTHVEIGPFPSSASNPIPHNHDLTNETSPDTMMGRGDDNTTAAIPDNVALEPPPPPPFSLCRSNRRQQRTMRYIEQC